MHGHAGDIDTVGIGDGEGIAPGIVGVTGNDVARSTGTFRERLYPVEGLRVGAVGDGDTATVGTNDLCGAQ